MMRAPIRSTPTGRPRRRAAVTLLEVVLAMSLLTLVSSMTYWFYSSSLSTRATGTERARKLQLMRIVLDRLSTEIRQASLSAGGQLVGIKGEPESIELQTLRVPGRNVHRELTFEDDEPIGESDIATIRYRIARHPEITHEDGYDAPLGLSRTEKRSPRLQQRAEEGEAVFDEALLDEEGQAGALIEDTGDGAPVIGAGEDIRWDELYSQEIIYLRFCYFDGYKWWDQWDIAGENPLPQIVLVAMGTEPRAPFGEEMGLTPEEEFCTCMNEIPVNCDPIAGDLYTVMIRVPQADVLFRSRVTRETQALIQEMGGAEEEDAQP